MRVCTCWKCGELNRDNPLWRGSRYDFNADYMRFSDAFFEKEFEDICLKLELEPNFVPVVVGPNTFYRRGKGGMWLYRVPNEDFRVETEKRKPKGKQLRLAKLLQINSKKETT